MAKLNTITDSEALYTTDDLKDRLDEETLLGDSTHVDLSPPKLTQSSSIFDSEFPETDPPIEAEEVILEPESIKALITITVAGESRHVNGTLRTFSFGKGWLCTLDAVEENEALEAAAHFDTSKKDISVLIHIKNRCVQISGELDFTISFGYRDATFTVTSDEGHYVST